jgi:hypothetical protein
MVVTSRVSGGTDMGSAGRQRATGRAGWRARWVATAVAGLLVAGNDQGVVVGYSTLADGGLRATLFAPR